MNRVKPVKYLLAALTVALCFYPVKASAAESAEKQRQVIRDMEKETLEKLYAEKPDTRREIQDAVGYAVFSSGELAVIWVSAGFGHGVAHDNRNNQDIYMQMAKAGVGLGLGAKDFNVVFIFHDPDSFHKFTTVGLDLTGTADAAAQTDTQGGSFSGALDVLPGVRIYQFTDTGLMAQAMVQGTKYWRDDSLNDNANVAMPNK